MKDHSIYVDQDRYATSIVAKYLDTATVKGSTKFYKTTLSPDMISTKDDTYTSDEKFRSWLVHSTFTTYLALVHLFIYFLQD